MPDLLSFSPTEYDECFGVQKRSKYLIQKVDFGFKYQKILPEIKTANIIKVWEREYNIFTMSSWVKMLEVLNSKKLGENVFSAFITFYRNGVAEHFRSTVEEEEFEKRIGDKFVVDNDFKNQILQAHTNNAEHLISMFEEIENNSSFAEEFVADFNLSFGRFSAANTAIQRSSDYLSKSKENSGIVEEFIAQRTRYEHVMAFFDRHFLILCEKIDKEAAHFLRLLTATELIVYIRTKQLPAEIENRNDFCALIILPSPMILVGVPAKQLHEHLNSQEAITNAKLKGGDEIHGTGIYPAKVSGHVQVIYNVKDLKNYEQGKILVTTATLPQYTQYLKQARCIITDEGGMLTHAAVLSRELKIPAVVGTKIATKVLRDGDLIEVDSGAGIIKIIKKHESI